MIKNFFINFNNVKNSKDLALRFNEVFNFAYPPIRDDKMNWDSFNDSFRSLDTESKTFINDPDFVKISGVHLILENYKTLDNLDSKDKKNLEEILEDNTKNGNRYDGLCFSYEIIN